MATERGAACLERDSLVSRTLTPSVPVRVDYELTPLGETSYGTRCLALHGPDHRLEVSTP
ncbi:winged helix-turn-helix transcriptional regulator [Nonomuraea turcica]|uniref:winged helix-turn-helix transcriptional regulator n=1 Tax=Nonomuraea sp. G32 TaxID=3067274 RepID=UPI00273ABAA8|nr:winged helix-turn-helix transcriptional regulator [Nonomuraea sp. G32]MDP4503654.1 winged helix-turn-helix transcriptional regulator [Nonomuraea sp. G32]